MHGMVIVLKWVKRWHMPKSFIYHTCISIFFSCTWLWWIGSNYGDELFYVILFWHFIFIQKKKPLVICSWTLFLYHFFIIKILLNISIYIYIYNANAIDNLILIFLLNLLIWCLKFHVPHTCVNISFILCLPT